MQKQQKPQQTYNSGIVIIHEAENSAVPGNMPKRRLKTPALYTLRFDERVVGYGRLSMGLQAGMKIDRLYRCPRRDDVTTKCVVLHSGKQYEIKQVQYPPDVYPPSMDLSLERVEPDVAYSIS